MKLGIQKVHPDAQIPKMAYSGSSGFDVYNVEETRTLQPMERGLFSTGLKVSMEEGYEIQVRPRSGLALKSGITIANTPGTIDQSWTGTCCVILINLSKEPFVVEKGMRIAQFVVQAVPHVEIVEVSSVDETERGEKGFGSSGVK